MIRTVLTYPILSTLAQCVDSLGFLAPIIVNGKLLIQRMWMLKLDWDTEISEASILKEWTVFIDGMPLLTRLKIPRCFFDNYVKVSGRTSKSSVNSSVRTSCNVACFEISSLSRIFENKLFIIKTICGLTQR